MMCSARNPIFEIKVTAEGRWGPDGDRRIALESRNSTISCNPVIQYLCGERTNESGEKCKRNPSSVR